MVDVIADASSKQLWSLSSCPSLDLGLGLSCQDSQDFQDDDGEAWRARSDCGGRATLSKHGMEGVCGGVDRARSME